MGIHKWGGGGAKDAWDVKEERNREVAEITGKGESTNTLCPKMTMLSTKL